MCQVQFLREHRTVSARPGESLLALMRREGIGIDPPCGGQGKCGKCRVLLPEGETLACQTRIIGDMTVDTSPCAHADGRAQILTQSTLQNTDKERIALLRLLRLQVPPCPTGESSSDWTRFSRALSDAAPDLCAKEDWTPDPAIASALVRLLKERKGLVFALVFQNHILRVSSEPFPFYLAAFDLGTTTVAAYLLEGETGTERAAASRMNPQTRYGADVIARANYSLESGIEPVSACIREAVNSLLAQMAEEAGICPEDIYLISVAGNTCMHHLFLGIDVDSLVHAPYHPAISEGMILPAKAYGIGIHPAARMLMLPNIAGFVGADTVACLTASFLAEQKDWTLLIDIGTNGEMVLGRGHCLTACSTAAGPAFEGAGISCGMRGLEGAISRVRWRDGRWEYTVIGGGRPRGICGSGLLDLVAELLRTGRMDETGQLQCAGETDEIERQQICGPTQASDRARSAGQSRGDALPRKADRIVVAKAQESADGREISLSQKDVRQLQLAKAAIAAGVRLLAKRMGIRLEQISRVWLAGAFGTFLSPESACAIGLIPPELSGRIEGIGNAAGEGAKAVLKDARRWQYALKIADETSFLELASMAEFNDCFLDELMFPEEESC